MSWDAMLKYLLNRLKEPTSWAGIIAFISGVVHLTFTQEQVQALSGLGIALAGAILAFMPNTLARKTVVRLPNGSTVKAEQTTSAPDVVVHGNELPKGGVS